VVGFGRAAAACPQLVHQCTQVVLWLTLLAAAGCDQAETPAGSAKLPDTGTVLPDIGAQFGSDTAADQTDVVQAQSDTSTSPDGSAAIVSCAGHCGVYLEDNPCHCHADCAKEGNCCGGNAAFAGSCSCTTAAQCDDGSLCTSDSCLDNICRQIPVSTGCCTTNADCTGGDACTVASCEAGKCALIPKACDDGLACTADSCEDGTCNHTKVADTCYIEGLCYAKGDSAPNGCGVCDPAKSDAGFSPPPGQCQIDGACYPPGPSETMPCVYCDVVANPTAWTVKVGYCVVDGLCVEDGASKAGSSCLQCKPANSKTSWTLQDGFCHIGDACIAAGGSAGGCKSCDPKKDPKTWTPLTGAACTAPCLTGGTCSAGGECVGQALPPAQCCAKDEDCTGLVPNLTDCQKAACNPVSKKCQAQTVESCCTVGVCCDQPTKSFKPAGSSCNGPISDKEYKCEGKDIVTRTKHAGCTGSHQSSCNEAYPWYSTWAIYQACGQSCTLDASTGQPKCVN